MFQGLGLDGHPFSMPQPSIRLRLHLGVAELSELLMCNTSLHLFV